MGRRLGGASSEWAVLRSARLLAGGSAGVRINDESHRVGREIDHTGTYLGWSQGREDPVGVPENRSIETQIGRIQSFGGEKVKLLGLANRDLHVAARECTELVQPPRSPLESVGGDGLPASRLDVRAVVFAASEDQD